MCGTSALLLQELYNGGTNFSCYNYTQRQHGVVLYTTVYSGPGCL